MKQTSLVVAMILTCFHHSLSSHGPFSRCSQDEECVYGSICQQSDCVVVKCQSDADCSSAAGHRCLSVGYSMKCVPKNITAEKSYFIIRSQGQGDGCTSDSNCKQGYKCFKPGSRAIAGICRRSFGTCTSDCDCSESKTICHGAPGSIGHCFCTRVDQNLCGQPCKNNTDCDMCSVCLSGICSPTPGIMGCLPTAIDDCLPSPDDTCVLTRNKTCCTDCDCIHSCQGTFCNACSGTCVGPEPWNCHSLGMSGRSSFLGSTVAKPRSSLCNINDQCPKHHCCKNSACKPFQSCYNVFDEYGETGQCNDKEVKIAFGKSLTTGEEDCACTCDGSDPAKGFQITRVTSDDGASRGQLSTSVPGSVPKKPFNGNSFGSYYDYFVESSKRKSRQSIDATCSNKKDVGIELKYDPSGKCSCKCLKGVDGNWSSWSDWGSCSASCEGGTRTRSRTCSDPAPTRSGRDCQGSAEESESCNTQECPCCKCSNLQIKADTCILCEVPDVEGVYINQGIDSNNETCTYSKTENGKILELISHPRRRGWGVLFGRIALAFGRSKGSELSPKCPVGWMPLRGWQSLTKKDSSNTALYIGYMDIMCQGQQSSTPLISASIEKKLVNEQKVEIKYKNALPPTDISTLNKAYCCNAVLLSYDHCLDCYYDGYVGKFSKQDNFYFNIDRNLYLFRNPSGTWSVGSTLSTEAVSSTRVTACPEDPNSWEYYHPDLKSQSPLTTFTVKCE